MARPLLCLKPRVAMARLSKAPMLTTQTQRMTGRGLQERNKRFKQANPLCVCCKEAGRIRAVAEVDHVIPLHLGGVDDESNLQGLCLDCHEAKSTREARARYGVGGQISGLSPSETDVTGTHRKYP